jgi:transposase
MVGAGWWEWRRLWKSGCCIRHGKSIREIARETGLSRNTVQRYLSLKNSRGRVKGLMGAT